MRVVVILVSAVLFLLVALWIVPSDVVKGRYRSLQEARNDGFIEKGWLPDRLPPSTYDISYANNLDLSTATGRFRFEPKDYPLLQHQLAPYSAPKNPFSNLSDEVDDHIKHGHPALQFIEDGSVWVFTCTPEEGACDYTMWLER